MADFFQTQKSKVNMVASSKLHEFWWINTICVCDHSYAKYIDTLYQPHQGLKATSVIFWKISLNIIVYFTVTFDGFGDFYKLKTLRIFLIPPPWRFATLLKPSVDKCWSFCKLDVMHVAYEWRYVAYEWRYADEIRYHRLKWVLKS